MLHNDVAVDVHAVRPGSWSTPRQSITLQQWSLQAARVLWPPRMPMHLFCARRRSVWPTTPSSVQRSPVARFAKVIFTLPGSRLVELSKQQGRGRAAVRSFEAERYPVGGTSGEQQTGSKQGVSYEASAAEGTELMPRRSATCEQHQLVQFWKAQGGHGMVATTRHRFEGLTTIRAHTKARPVVHGG